MSCEFYGIFCPDFHVSTCGDVATDVHGCQFFEKRRARTEKHGWRRRRQSATGSSVSMWLIKGATTGATAFAIISGSAASSALRRSTVAGVRARMTGTAATAAALVLEEVAVDVVHPGCTYVGHRAL
jgi:hypothetical protein